MIPKASVTITNVDWEDAPYVCPGCHAIGPERCAPGCIDAEILEESRRQEWSEDHDDREDDE